MRTSAIRAISQRSTALRAPWQSLTLRRRPTSRCLLHIDASFLDLITSRLDVIPVHLSYMVVVRESLVTGLANTIIRTPCIYIPWSLFLRRALA